MLDFLAHYPLAYYIKTLSNPRKRACRIGLFLSRDANMILLKSKLDNIYWNGNLREINGAPSLDDTLQKNTEKLGNQIPSAYRKDIHREFGLNKTNEVSVIIDDPETYTTPYTVTQFDAAGDLEAALLKDPSSIITAWKNYNHNAEYIWEILSTSGMHLLRDNTRLPKKVILCGFPEERAIYTAKWCEENDQELVNLIPLIPAVLKWGIENGPKEGFFLLIQAPNEIAISYIENGEIRIFSTQKTRDGFTPDEIQDVNELADETGRGKEVPIWCWGILPGSTPHSRLATRYPTLKTLTPEELRKIHPLSIKNEEHPLQEKEAWLLDNILK